MIGGPGCVPRRAWRGLRRGAGRIKTSHAHYVSFERASSESAEMVMVYYDSHPNLVARGVIREPRPLRPHPHPFPGFLPDPQAQPFVPSPYGC